MLFTPYIVINKLAHKMYSGHIQITSDKPWWHIGKYVKLKPWYRWCCTMTSCRSGEPLQSGEKS